MTCPTPEKHAHRSRRAAERHLLAMDADKGVDLALRPYRCECGAWHLGHRKQSLEVQIRYSLGAGRKATRAARRRRTR